MQPEGAGAGHQRIAVIMAGGSGERFWPVSRPERPKQLLRLSDPNQTLLEESVGRIAPLVGTDNVLIATSPHLTAPIVEAEIVPERDVIAEPVRRNTLGCLVWVAANLLARGQGDASVAVLTADHKIGAPDRFRKTVDAALNVAEREGGLVTIGITPTRPETGYGYIETDPLSVTDAGGYPAYRSRSFREKPSAETAQAFLAAANFLWNSGMFFFTLPGFLRELQVAQPEAHAITHACADALAANDQEAAREAFERLPNLSIDYAVMEKAECVFVVPSDFPWDDIGAWDALERSLTPDDQGMVTQGRVITVDSRGSIVVNDTPGVVATLGVEDLIVVATHDAVLVLPKGQAQRVKEVTAKLAELQS